MVLVLERQDGLQEEPRKGLRRTPEPDAERAAEHPVIAEVDANNDGSATFSGYLLRWDDVAQIWDFFGEYEESFETGSFIKTFNERGPKGNNAIKMLRQHQTRGTFIPGKFTDLWEDSQGPAFEGRTIGTDDGNQMAIELREGVLNTMSIAFDSMREEYVKKENRFIVREAKLYEASPVYWPAYESATIDSVRNIDQLVPSLARFLSILESGGELTEEQIGQLNMIRARITDILGEPRATTLPEDNQATNEYPEATAGGSHRSQEELLARLRLRMKEHGLS